ncbi:MAG TPA: methylated-DNA--[protein]-cysteine S-methyltransferase [Solirubrobacteraceae bacterium]|jgi:methylated-DNA-[protein]-cysteine S-methyltransferase|nr:methylated-DNA--[protein]-cysteine S-methyltransferase [Solirubrobacteraceae bacterium]
MTIDLERALRDPGAVDAAAAQERFVRRALHDGLADIAYAPVDSPVGALLAAVTPRGLVRLAYEDGRGDAVLAELAARVSPRVIEAPARLDDVRRQLDEYFAGRRHTFDLGIDWALTRGFTQRVLRRTAAVPFGELASYREVATGAGNAAAVRAAGNALGANPMPIVVPCHRIVRTGGALGGYTGGVQRKEYLLRLEGTLPR